MEHKSITLHAQIATAFQANVFLKEINYLLITSKRGRDFSKRKTVVRSNADFPFTICCTVKWGETFT
jgi:hypothetical protein